ncbi:MAG: YggT family protein [Lautropia sp.]|nr:YggT family protein [Lautropia sp.]
MLIQTVASLLASACLLRVYACWLGMSPHSNPLVGFAVALTQWLVRPVGRLIKPSRGLDWPSVVAAVVVGLTAALAFSLVWDVMFSPVYVVLLGLLWVVRWGLYLAMMLIIMSAVLTIINPQAPLAWPLAALTAPLLKPFRRIVPLVGQFDLSPLVALLVIQVVLVLFDPTVVLALLSRPG